MTGAHAGDHARARHQQRVEELCVAAIRALTGESDLHFRGRLLHRGRRRVPLHAPQLYPDPDDDFTAFRGASDGMAMRLGWSDVDLHRELAPEDGVERTVFEMLEQFRVESLAPAALPGVVANLRHRHEQWSLALHHAGLTESDEGILVYTVAQVCRAQVTGEPVVQETEELLESTRGGVAPLLGEDLAGLRRQRCDQRAYAVHARAIAQSVAHTLAEVTAAGSDEAADSEAHDRARLPLFVDFDDDSVDAFATAGPGGGHAPVGTEHEYRAFTTAYDRECDVSALVRPAQLRSLRARLDQRVAEQGVNVTRLARELRLLLADPAEDGWDGGLEEGHIDGRRLSQLVTSPTERRLFRAERVEPVPSCLVTFLVDCSGSMKEHAETVAMLVDVFGRALQLAGISNEVLGFTTGAWNGGRALRDWQRAGRPGRPGRLNELTHIVFKSAETSWRGARPGVAGLLKSDLFREGIDGEAVEWACTRMVARTEERRLLVVVSDGSPMDGATNLVNDEHYLDSHLEQVVLRQDLLGQVRVHGLGVGLDLSPYYSRVHALDLSGGAPNSAFGEILGLLAGVGRR